MGHSAVRTRFALVLSWGILAVVPGVVIAAVASAAVRSAAVADAGSQATRATFVLRFTEYVEWPEAALPSTELRVAVLGDPAMVTGLQVAADRQESDRRITVTRVLTAAQARDAHVLVVGRSRNASLRSVSRQLGSHPVLLVTAEAGALGSGSMINFVDVPGRVRFEVGLATAQRAGLRISSELLSVAARVER